MFYPTVTFGIVRTMFNMADGETKDEFLTVAYIYDIQNYCKTMYVLLPYISPTCTYIEDDIDWHC